VVVVLVAVAARDNVTLVPLTAVTVVLLGIPAPDTICPTRIKAFAADNVTAVEPDVSAEFDADIAFAAKFKYISVLGETLTVEIALLEVVAAV
jgi:hypothetical protein